MRKTIQLTPAIETLVSIHKTRNTIPEPEKILFDFYIGEKTGLFTHLTYSGAVYYGRKALSYPK